MEFVKTLLSEYIEAEKLDDVIEKFNAEFPKHAVPKNVFNEKNDELKAVKDQLAQTKDLADKLTQKAETVEAYENQVTEWKEKYSELETNTNQRISEITKTSQFKEHLMKSAAHEDAIDLLLEKYTGSVELAEDGTLKEVDAVIEKMRTERPGLFKEVVEESTDKGGNKTPTKEKSPSEMNSAEYAAWYTEREKSRQPL